MYINPICFPGEVTIQVHEVLTKYWQHLDLTTIPNIEFETLQVDNTEWLVPKQEAHLKLPETLNAAKFMDDATCQELIDINSTVVSNIDRSGPLPFWESSGKILPPQNSLLQNEINNVKRISDEREMKLNAKKTFLFVVNFTKIHQFKPHLSIPGENEYLKTVQETKLLGYWLTTDMKPHIHVQYLLSIVNKRMWAVSKLKLAGVCDFDLTHFYIMKIRSVLESNAVVFHSMLTMDDSDNIERIQKSVCHIIMGSRYISYEESVLYLDLENLRDRRTQLCLNFALKCSNSGKFKHLFELVPLDDHNIRHRRTFLEPQCTTERYRNSPLVYLTRLLNQHLEKNIAKK